MRLAIVLTVCFFVGSCIGKVASVPVPVTPTVPPQSAASPRSPLHAVELNLPLDKKQKKYLNASVPEEVRDILERSESLEILAEVDTGKTKFDDSRDFNPNRIAMISTERQKEEILRAFYLDAASDEPPAVCYEPHHAIRATYKGTTAEIEICFSCSRFVVTSLPGRPQGTLVRDGRRSEDLLTKIIQEVGVELKK